MSTNYDPAAQLFPNSHSMENYEYSSSTKPSSGQVHGVETEPSQRLTKQLFVNSVISSPGPSLSGQKDKMLTDLGIFQLATEGIPVSDKPTIIGELWVSYKVKLTRAALTDILAHNDLEVQSIETIFSSTTAVPSSPRDLSVFDGSTLRLETRLSGTSLLVEFPPSIASGVYRVHCILSGETFDVNGSANIVPVVTASNCSVLTTVSHENAWELGTAINVTPGSLSSVFDRNTVITATNNHPMVCGYVRLDHPHRDLTKSAELECKVLPLNAPGQDTFTTRMRVIISECNEQEALSVRSQGNNTDFAPWTQPDPLIGSM